MCYLHSRVDSQEPLITFRCLNDIIDFDFNFKHNTASHYYNKRQCNKLHLPAPKTTWGKQGIVLSFFALDGRLERLNNLPFNAVKLNFVTIFVFFVTAASFIEIISF